MSKNFSSPRYKTHEEYMLKILHGLFSSSVASHIAFKGGTLAYFCYDLDRYSTDIDLDLLDHSYEKEVMDLMTSLLSGIGEIKNYTRGADLHRWIFRYDDQSTNIKVELNKRDISYNSYEIKTIHGQDVQCMDVRSMVTNKLLALYNRRYNRDLYDVHFFRKNNYSYDPIIVQQRTGKSLKEVITEIIQILPDRYAINSILADGMGDVLTDKQKPRVKNNLMDETVDLLKQYLNTL